MAKRVWNILLGGRSHTVELHHSVFSAFRSIRVDGEEVWIDPATQYRVADTGSIHPFEIAGVSCAVFIRGKAVQYEYDLVIDGKVHPTGEVPEPPAPRPVRMGPEIYIERAPRASAAVFALFTLVCVGSAAVLAQSAATRPSEPALVQLASLGNVGEDAWVDVHGLSVRCAEPPIVIDEEHYRPAGMDGESTLLVLAVHADTPCVRDHASGELSTPSADYPMARDLAQRLGASRVRVLYTFAGPENDLIGVVVCALLGAACALLTAFAWVRRERAALAGRA
jgi:hypothetical protein